MVKRMWHLAQPGASYKTVEQWQDECTLLVQAALDAAYAEGLREAAKEAIRYEDACIMGEIAHGNKAATRHGRAAAKAIAQAIERLAQRKEGRDE
jgi:hypothetical protein